MTSPANESDLVQHDPARQRFSLRIDGQLGLADYRLVDGVMHLVHTEVSPGLQGRGVAARLVAAALDHAAAQGLRVKPVCSYVRAYMRRHPESASLLA